MARRTFISYKYNEARELRDAIVGKLGTDAQFYQGETADSPDLTNTSVENIKNILKDMIFSTSVTIVIISPSMKNSRWIDWEIEYSLKEIGREDRISRTNGIVGVIMKYYGSYDWLVSNNIGSDGCHSRVIDSSFLYPIITKNRLNLNVANRYSCPVCMSFSRLDGSYISLINEEEFLADTDKYIENSFEKSSRISNYNIFKER